MKMFSDYLKEREGVDVLEIEHGFATYSMQDAYIYLQDIYVVPEQRKSGVGVELMNMVAEIGKKAGKNKMLGSVCPSTPFSTTMMQIMFRLGFKLAKSQEDIIYLIKEI